MNAIGLEKPLEHRIARDLLLEIHPVLLRISEDGRDPSEAPIAYRAHNEMGDAEYRRFAQGLALNLLSDRALSLTA